MAEMDTAGVGTQNQDVAPQVVAETSTPADVKPSEKMISQSEVNKITGRIRDETRQEYYERGKREALAELERNRQPESTSQSMGGVKQFSPEEIEQLVENKFRERENQLLGQRIAGNVLKNFEATKDKYSDFDESIGRLNLQNIPHILTWASDLDNSGDVMYHLSKNPSKYANILTLAHPDNSPDLARLEMQKLSDSLKKNANAQVHSSIEPPLSQIKATPVGTDNGRMGIKDLRRQPWMKA